jgi:hypothetical protein
MTHPLQTPKASRWTRVYVYTAAFVLGLVAGLAIGTRPEPGPCTPRAVRPNHGRYAELDLQCHPDAHVRTEGDVTLCVCPSQLRAEAE